jgi:uncharacterized protein (TIGR02594 family)
MPQSNTYAWLGQEPAPRMVVQAVRLLGTLEEAGSRDNPTILAWADEVGGAVDDVYKADSIPWCGLFMAVVAKRAGREPPRDPLWALNWGTFGVAVPDRPMLGDTLVFVRRTPEGKRAGHVALYVGEDGEAFHCLGGNQSDRVCVTRMPRTRLYAARRPAYSLRPENVRFIELARAGELSSSEA